MNAAGPGWGDDLRLSDAERDRASHVLGEHFAQGRLDADEHAERHERIWAAKTRGEIPPLFTDLPGGSPLHPQAPRQQPGPAYGVPFAPPFGVGPWSGAQRPPRPRRRGLPMPLKVVLGFVLLMLVVAHWPLVLVAFGGWCLLSHRRHSRAHPSGVRGPGLSAPGCGRPTAYGRP